MPSRDEDIPEEPPSIDPYEVLGINKKATADEVKKAYRKEALKHHPDKAAPDAKESANKKFQEIAFAYAVLSDERRRRRYDTTGNTAESLGLEDDEFDWVDFFRDQLSSMVSGETLDKFRDEYKGSEEERGDLLGAYERFEGDMDAVYEEVMLSNVLDDDERFRGIIDQAIRDGEVTEYPKYTKESTKDKKERKKRAKKEAEEAEELARELGVEEKLFGTGKAKGGKGKKGQGKQDDEDALMSLIQQRQKSRADTFFADLEAKYAPSSKGGKGKGKKRGAEEEPPEEAFEANKRKGKNGKKDGKSEANGRPTRGRPKKQKA